MKRLMKFLIFNLRKCCTYHIIKFLAMFNPFFVYQQNVIPQYYVYYPFDLNFNTLPLFDFNSNDFQTNNSSYQHLIEIQKTTPEITLQQHQKAQISSTIEDKHLIQNQIQNELQIYPKKRQFKKFSIYKYPKKNAESNTINQIFSFLCLRLKSQSILQKIFKYDVQKVDRFYTFINALKKQNKKYINRNYLSDLMEFNQNHPGNKILREQMKNDTKEVLSVQDLKKGVRILVQHYLKTKCMLSIITSRKLEQQTIREHLSRRRQIIQHFNETIQRQRLFRNC